jgi:hypothetical protein
MDNNGISRLSEEQLAVLNDELRAVFCSLKEKDQIFFASNFAPKDLPNVLTRKGEIMRRNKAKSEELERLVASFKENIPLPVSDDTAESVLMAAAGALGIGAAATAVATNNTGFYQGVRPSDLVEPLRIEFEDSKTTLSATGSPDALTATVFLRADTRLVPAMTMTLTAMNNGCEVTVNDLSAQGVLESIKSGGEKILDIAEKGFNLFRQNGRHLSPQDLITAASQTLESGAGLADSVRTLKLKDRAWKVIKQTAEAVEASYRDRLEKERQEQTEIELAWDRYNNCSNCGVSFAPEATLCRVCATGRPDKPLVVDPRLPDV